MGVERKAHPGDITRGDGGHKMGSRSGRGLVGCKLLVVTVKDCAKLTVLAAAVMVCVCVWHDGPFPLQPRESDTDEAPTQQLLS